MKVIKNINQIQELAERKTQDLIKLLQSDHAASWRHVLDASNNDYSLLEVIEEQSEQFVGYGEIMGNLKGFDIYQMYTKSIVESLNTNTVYQEILEQYNELKNEVEIQGKVVFDLIKHEISTYAELDDHSRSLIDNIENKERFKEILMENHTLNHFIETTFDINFNRYEFDTELLETLTTDLMKDPELIELRNRLEVKKSNDYKFTFN